MKKTYVFSVTEISHGTIKIPANSMEEAEKMIECGEYCMDVHDSEFTDVELIYIED